MLLYQLGLLLVLLPVCCFAPGYFFVRKFRWNPLEKLCGSIGLSLILLYLACWAIFCVSPSGNSMPAHAEPFEIISVASLVMAVASAKDIARLWRAAPVRRALAGFGFLLLWTAIQLAVIRNFSGAAWFGDWLEHFQRTLFFLHRFPHNTPIFPGYVVPARPPMMNVIAAFFLAQTADLFELFQAVFVFLNLLLFLPCYLMVPALSKRGKRRTWLLVLLFASSPLFMQNVTYSWTKSCAAFFVVLAVWFYLAGWRKRDAMRTTAAFVSLAAGLLVHYSAGPYVAILTLHYLVRVWPRRPRKWLELAAIAGTCGLLVGTWLIWSMAIYGVRGTLLSNTTVTLSQQYEGSTVEKICSNIFDSIVPVVVRDPTLLERFDRQREAGKVRDDWFVFYQVNAIFGMGLVGGPLILWLVYRALRRPPQPQPAPPPGRGKRPPKKIPQAPGKPTPQQRFWLFLIVGGLVLGIAVVGERDPQGVGHLTLLSLQMLGLSLLAAAIPWQRRVLVAAVLTGCAVDFSMGVFLQARVESLDNSPQGIVFPGMEFVQAQIQTAPPGPAALSGSAWTNWFVKHKLAAYYWWLRALDAQYANDASFKVLRSRFEDRIRQARSDDATAWQGWFDRHDGEVQFLGDHVAGTTGAGTNIALAMLAILFVALAGATYWRTS